MSVLKRSSPSGAARMPAAVSRLNGVKIIWFLLLFAIGLFMILPFIWMISTSLKSPSEVFNYPVEWIPSTFHWEHHRNVWIGEKSFTHYYLNSLKVSLLATAGALLLSSLAAYGFSRIEFKGRDAMFVVYLSMMMIPPQILFVPKFLMFNWMNIYNTHWALILPGMITIFGVFLLRQFFMKVPKDITESAFIDGAGHFTIFWKIILPLCKPAIATLAILDFSWNWGNYEDALIFLIDEKLYTVPLGMQNFVLEYSVDYNGMMAAASAALLPMILVFLIGQKFIIEGISSSAVKG